MQEFELELELEQEHKHEYESEYEFELGYCPQVRWWVRGGAGRGGGGAR